LTRKKSREGAEAFANVADRVRFLLDRLFEGNKLRMAKYIGCSHTAVTRIVLDRQKPGFTILKGLAKHEQVNATWLLTGSGEPLHAEPREGWSLPLLNAIPAGPPQEHPEYISDQIFPVARQYYRPSRYWLPVPEEWPFLKDEASAIKAGDLLLVETDREEIGRHLADWSTGAVLCMARVALPAPAGVQLCLGYASVRSLEGGLFAWEWKFHWKPLTKTTERVKLIGVRMRPGRSPEAFVHEYDSNTPDPLQRVRVTPVPAPGTRPPRRRSTYSDSLFWPTVEFGDIVGICLVLCRRNLEEKKYDTH
jgi:hypothetical protein